MTAREVRSPVVRLRAVSGTIIYVGPIVVGGRYELTAVDGDIRMTLRPLPFRVVAQAPRGNIVAADFALDGLQSPNALDASWHGGGASLALRSLNGSIALRQEK